jgi:hypothetical protein
MAILFLYRRLFTMHIRWFRVLWWASFLFVLLWLVICLTLTGLTIGTGDPTGILQRYGSPITGFGSASCDLMVIVLPVNVIRKLNLPLKDRLGIIAIFCLGLL